MDGTPKQRKVAADLLALLQNGGRDPVALTVTRSNGLWTITYLAAEPIRSETHFGQGVSLEDALNDLSDIRLRTPLTPAEMVQLDNAAALTPAPQEALG